MSDDPAAQVARLSSRERDCLRLVAQLKRTKAIAFELGISESSVDNACAGAARKLGVASRMEAARVLSAAERLPEPPVSFPQDAEPSVPHLGESWRRRFLARVARLPWPVPTKERPTNDLTVPQLAFAILVACATLLLCAAAYVVAVAALTDIY